jgi:hypothetical protein
MADRVSAAWKGSTAVLVFCSQREELTDQVQSRRRAMGEESNGPIRRAARHLSADSAGKLMLAFQACNVRFHVVPLVVLPQVKYFRPTFQ